MMLLSGKYFVGCHLDPLMKTMVRILPLGAACLALTLQAATLNEWNFYSDPAGKTLSQAVNSVGTAAFSVGEESGLATDGLGSLFCAQDDSGSTTGMWTNGAILDATLSSPVSSGVQYLRYDFSYDLSSTNNDSGGVAGFAFYDQTSNKVAGVALQYDVGANTNPAYQVTELTELTNTVGMVAVVAKINLSNQTLSVWYNLTGDVSGFTSNAPMSTVSNLTLGSFDSLRFQSTGDLQPAGSTDGIAVDLLRTADSWADVVAAAPETPAAKYANEWTFERDVDGRSLNEAINSGTNSPLAQFTSGFGSTVFTTNRTLLCVGEDVGSDGVWTNGAVLDAALTSSSSGIHYLRYDVEYDFSSPSNNSGTVLGVYFTGDSGTKAAGLVMGYDTGTLTNSIPVNRTLTSIPGATDIAKVGTLSAIAEVDLDNDTLKVWYDLSGSNVFVQGSPVLTNSIAITTLDNLRFHATGDFHPAGSSDFAAVDNIRQAGSWTEIIEAPADLTAPPSLSFTVTNSLDGAMGLGETNLVTVVISNAGGAGAATQVTSALSNDLSATAFTIISNNTSVSLAAGESVTNTYELVANERGSYTIYVSARSAEINTDPKSFSLAAGANLIILPPVIAEPGGSYAGLYEPGETLNITITTTNDGAKAVSNIVNSLSAASAGFAISPSSASYPSLATGAATSTVYTVDIGAGVAAGIYTFNVTNSAGSLVWTNSFDIEVFIRVPNTDWVKANNTNHLNLGSSWVGGAVPNSTDRAILDSTVTAPITTDLGGDLFWRGIALVSNTAAWTISGTNTLTLGSASIDMSQAQTNLTIAAQLALGTTQSWNVVTSRTLTVSGAISGADMAPVVKSGEGTLVITNTANNFAGNITVSDGTLLVANNNVLGKGSLTLDGAAMATAGNAILTNSVVLTGAAAFNNANDLTLSGTVSGSGSLTKSGNGTLILNGANTYSGGTTNSGTIEANTATALGSGDVIMNAGGVLQAAPLTFGLNSTGIGNNIVLNGDATIRTQTEISSDLIAVDGSIGGFGKLTVDGYQIVLRGNNTFSGGLHLSHNNWLRFHNINALGTGPISMDRTSLLLAYVSGTLANDIELTHTLRLHLNNKTIELSGQISGTGILQFTDQDGTITLSGNNEGWTGGIANFRRANLVVAHTNALGTGSITFNGDRPVTVSSTVDLTVGNGLVNAMQFEEIANPSTLETHPIEFNLSNDMKISGQITDGATSNTEGLRKTGSANLILTAMNTFTSPTDISAGKLTVDGGLDSPQITVASGATLSGTGSVQVVTMRAGSMLDLSQGAMTFNGNLNAGSGVATKLAIPNTTLSGLIGNGSNALLLGGSLNLDFTSNVVGAGVIIPVFSNWGSLTDNGVSVSTFGLSGNLTLDTSNLFVDGTVLTVATSSPELTITPSLLILQPLADGLAQGQVIVSNTGSQTVNFTITQTFGGDVSYSQEVGTSSSISAATPVILKTSSPTIDPTTRGVSEPIAFGFNFPLYGATYSHFYVTADGVVGLTSSTNMPAALGDSYGGLPDGDGKPLIAPFWSALRSPEGSIRYKAYEDKVVISYVGVEKLTYGGTNLSFQAILYADGQVEFRYKNINGDRLDRVTVGIQGSTEEFQEVGLLPASGMSVMLAQERWVSATVQSGSVGPNQSVPVTFVADATGRGPGDEATLTSSFNWSLDKGYYTVSVLAQVVAATPGYSAETNLSFSGSAGEMASVPFVITNTGNGPLNFTISDDSALTATMFFATNVVYDWVDISSLGTDVELIKPGVNPFVTAADEGYSDMIPVGFAFPFFGNSYSEFCIGVNGALRLDTTGRIFDVRDIAAPIIPAILPDQLIAPYGGDLFIDGNATLKYHSTAERLVVTWENMGQYGYQAGSNLTFQVILKPSGAITFQYKFLEGHQWPKTVVGGLRNIVGETGKVGAGDIRQAGDWTINTNYPVSSTSYIQYVDSVAERIIAVQPDEVQVITYTPNSGSIPVGGTAEITVTGNATGLSAGGNTIITGTQLNIEHNGTPGTNTLDVTFTVTNSQQTVFVSADDSDGDGVADDDERIAGTDPQDAASVFTPEVTRTASGAFLSWEAPLDGLQRTYKIYWTADLMSGWSHLATVTDGTAYLDTAHSKELVVYYKVTAE